MLFKIGDVLQLTRIEWASGDRSNVVSWDYGVIEPSDASKQRRSDDRSFTFSESTFAKSSAGPAPASYAPSDKQKRAVTGTSASSGVSCHRFYRQTQQVFTQTNDQAEWGDWIYATEQVANLTYSNGASDVDARGSFISDGYLNNTQNTDFRAINDAYPVFAFSIDYGTVDETVQSSLFTITLVQDEAIQFVSSSSETQSLPPIWTETYTNELEVVSPQPTSYTTYSKMLRFFSSTTIGVMLRSLHLNLIKRSHQIR